MSDVPNQSSSLNDDGFIESILQSASDPNSLGSVEAMVSFVQVLLADFSDMLNHPQVRVEDRPKHAADLIERAADRVMQEKDAAWFAGLPGRLEAMYPDELNTRARLVALLRQLILDYVDGLHYAETPGVLEEQWSENILGLIESTADVLLGIADPEVA